MEKELILLFDYQRFEKNPELEAVIRSVLDKTSARRLSLDQAGLVSAAGGKYLEDARRDDEIWK